MSFNRKLKENFLLIGYKFELVTEISTDDIIAVLWKSTLGRNLMFRSSMQRV